MVLLPMLEEFDTKLNEISVLVHEMEDKNKDFPEHCNQFLIALEELSRRYSIPVASGLSTLRGEMLCKEVRKQSDRKAARRSRDECLMAALAGARNQTEEYFAPWRKIFMECASLCRQMAAGAVLKGLISMSSPGAPALEEAWQGMMSDAELAPVLTHVVGLAGTTNTKILLDQALASVCAGMCADVGQTEK